MCTLILLPGCCYVAGKSLRWAYRCSFLILEYALRVYGTFASSLLCNAGNNDATFIWMFIDAIAGGTLAGQASLGEHRGTERGPNSEVPLPAANAWWSRRSGRRWRRSDRCGRRRLGQGRHGRRRRRNRRGSGAVGLGGGTLDVGRGAVGVNTATANVVGVGATGVGGSEVGVTSRMCGMRRTRAGGAAVGVKGGAPGVGSVATGGGGASGVEGDAVDVTMVLSGAGAGVQQLLRRRWPQPQRQQWRRCRQRLRQQRHLKSRHETMTQLILARLV